jgi:aspartate/methionine/tyrosine aminotransferase
LFGRALLTSPKLHEIIQANSSRLAVAYSRITTFFAENDIEYSPCEVTTFVLAKLAPGVKSREDEKNAVAFYQEAGILFFSAADYHMPAGFEGFMRVSFAVEPERMDVALKRLKVAYQKYLARSKLT